MWWVTIAWAAACEPVDLDAATRQARSLRYDDEDLPAALAHVKRVDGLFPCLTPVDGDDLLSFYLLAIEIAIHDGQERSAAVWAERAVRYDDAREPRGNLTPGVLEQWRAARARVEADGRVTLTLARGVILDGVPRAAGEKIAVLRGEHLGQYVGDDGWVSEALRVDAATTWPVVSSPPVASRWTPKRVGIIAGGVGLLATGVAMLVFDGGYLQQNARYGDLKAADIGTGLMAAGIVSAVAGTGLLLGGALSEDGASIRLRGRF